MDKSSVKEETSDIWVNDFEDSDLTSFVEDIKDSLQENPQKPIVIHINSDGGNVNNLFAMLDYMDSVRANAPDSFSFITVATGRAYSAAALLLSHGDYRFATRNTSIMIHQVQSGFWGAHPENKVQFKETERMNKQLLTILKENCTLDISLEELEEKLLHDLYFTPEDARAFGLIDIIGYPILSELKAYELKVLGGIKPEPEDKKPAKKKRVQKEVKNESGSGDQEAPEAESKD